MSELPVLKINEHDLSKELSMHAANYMYVADQAVRAEAVYDTKKYNLDQLAAELDSQVRIKAEADGKKVTEKAIEKEVEKHPSFKNAKLALIKAKAERNLLKANQEAWYQRKDSLIQLAIKERSELDSISNSKVMAAR